MEAEYYPPVGFYFRVVFDGDSFKGETSFKEVSGLNVEISTEDVAEGGELQFCHRLPKPPRYSNLILKRGLLTNSKLRSWIEKAVNSFEFSPIRVTIQLLNPESQPLMAWTAYNARPAKWEISPFDSGESRDVAVESLELAFDYFEAQKIAHS